MIAVFASIFSLCHLRSLYVCSFVFVVNLKYVNYELTPLLVLMLVLLTAGVLANRSVVAR